MSDLDDIARLTIQWARLLANSPCNRAFASPEWYRASCLYHPELRPFLLAAFRKEELAAILPLAIDQDHLARFPHYISDYNDIIARHDDTALVAGLMVHAVSSGICRRIVLSRLREDSNCLRALRLLGAFQQVRFDCREIDPHLTITLPASFDDYLVSRTKAFRTNLKQALRRMERDELTVCELQPGDFDPDELPELLISMARARQKEGSLFYRPEAIQFVRQVLPPVFGKRGLIASRLAQTDRSVGLYIHMLGHNSLGAWNGGFLPEVERWSPGGLLLA
ncbi:MAG TPA: GNAT family N-acetyltransferase, partial [Blastocatellia bacterium]